MSLPKFDVQGSLFESLGSIAANLFSDQDRYKLFATQVWPLLAQGRPELEGCYVRDNGRPGIEPVVLLGVLILQFLERVPDRQAAELLKYHLGWKLALNLDLNFKGVHHTTLRGFRDRLLAHAKSDLAMRLIGEGLQAAGWIQKRETQRLDSTHVVAAVARLSALECVRETLALALQGLNPNLSVEQRPAFWDVLWERYVENKLDYQSNDETLQAKRRQAGLDCWRLLQWLDSLEPELGGGKPVALLRAVWAQQFVMEADGQIEPVKVHATGVISEPARRGRRVVGQRPRQTEKGVGRLQGASRRDAAQSGRPDRFYYVGGHATGDRERRRGLAGDVGQAGRGGTPTAHRTLR